MQKKFTVHDDNLIFSQKCHVAIRLRESRQLQWQRGLLWRYREVRSNLFKISDSWLNSLFRIKNTGWQTVEFDSMLYAQWITIRLWVPFFFFTFPVSWIHYRFQSLWKVYGKSLAPSKEHGICFRSPFWSKVLERASLKQGCASALI